MHLICQQVGIDIITQLERLRRISLGKLSSHKQLLLIWTLATKGVLSLAAERPIRIGQIPLLKFFEVAGGIFVKSAEGRERVLLKDTVDILFLSGDQLQVLRLTEFCVSFEVQAV